MRDQNSASAAASSSKESRRRNHSGSDKLSLDHCSQRRWSGAAGRRSLRRGAKRPVDKLVKRDPGETMLKKDSQLDTAVTELLKQIQ
jgi:hypothetical protein